MQVNEIKELEKELLSLTYADLSLNIRNGHLRKDFSWLVLNVNAFAHWEGITWGSVGHDIYRQELNSFDNGIDVQFFRVVKIGDKHRYNDRDFISIYANQLRYDLMLRYDINIDDLRKIKTLHGHISKVHGEAVRLKEMYENCREYIIENKEQRIENGFDFLNTKPSLDDWYNFESSCLKKDVPTEGSGIRTSFGNDSVFKFSLGNGKVSYFNKNFFDDLMELFFCRKRVLELIIESLGKEIVPHELPASDKVEDIISGKDTFEQRLEGIKNANNTFLPNMPMSAVIEHFSVFYKKKNTKTDLPYLTEDQFINFLERAFLGNTNIAKQAITFTNGEKGFVISRFFDFYNVAVTNHRENGTNKDKYKSFIIDNFSNWNNITEIESSFRANISKNEW